MTFSGNWMLISVSQTSETNMDSFFNENEYTQVWSVWFKLNCSSPDLELIQS